MVSLTFTEEKEGGVDESGEWRFAGGIGRREGRGNCDWARKDKLTN